MIKKSNVRKPALRRQNAVLTTPMQFQSRGKGATAEKKWLDTAINQEASTTGVITPINIVGQGTLSTQRVGNSFKMISVQIRGAMGVGATATSASYRIMIVYDKQTNLALPAVTDIITAAGMDGLNNLTRKQRFVTIVDDIGYLEAAGKQVEGVSIYRKINLNTEYINQNALISSCTSGGLYLITVGTTGTGATSPLLIANARIRFTDP